MKRFITRKLVNWISNFFNMNEPKKRGGARPNSGRLKKDEVISLIESMDAITVPDTVWKMLYAKVLDSDVNAIKLWLSYRYGLPKQTIEQKTELQFPKIDMNEWK